MTKIEKPSIRNKSKNLISKLIFPAVLALTLSMLLPAKSASAATFASRCAATGVVLCTGFDAAGDISPYVFGNQVGTTLGVLDSANLASGTGSMKFTIPSLTGENSSGAYARVFNEAGNGFLPGSTFFVQFRQRFSPEMLTSAMGGNGWKQVELSTQFSGYGDPSGIGLYNQASGNKPVLYVNGATFPQNPADGIPVSYVANQWMTFAFEVDFNSWGTFTNTVKVWAAPENQPLKQIYNITNAAPGQNPGDPASGYNKIFFGPDNFGKLATTVHPVATTWYDELVVSANPIADSFTASPAKAITSFGFPQGAGVITGTNIVATVPFGTNVTALVPTIVTTGVSVSPLSGVAQNFTSPVNYTVTAADGTTQVYTVTVAIAANAAKAITAFSFPQGVGVITGTNIVATVPFGTNVTALVPTIVITGASISPLSGVARNFTSPVTYTVTAANGTTQVYTVTVAIAANTAKAITTFSFPQGVGVITGTNIVATVPFGTNVTALVPTIVTTGVSIAPLSGVARNFTSPLTYTVTAADGTTQVYTVTVVVASNPAKAITAFSFPQGVGVITGTNIVVTVPFGTSLTALVPTIVTTGISVAPLSGIAQNFTSPFNYNVTAADGTTQVYTVTVTAATSPAKAITAFSFPEGVGVITGTNIVATVPFGTNVTALVPTIVITGVSISPLSGIARNFTSPVTYTVTAANGTTQIYTVTVVVAASPAKAITAFSFPQGVGVITGTNIVATVPFGTDVTALVPTIVTTGVSIAPLSLIPQNFTSPVNYTVTAADATTQLYTVTVVVATNPAKAITAFSFPQGVGVITGTNIVVTVPFGTSLTALVPTIVITGVSVSPLSGIARNFTAPQTYTVTAADGTTQVYTVTVTVAPSPAKAITAFSFPQGVGVITGTNIVVPVPFGTDVTTLVPTIVITGVSVSPLSGIARNFTSPLTYTVTAANGTTQIYTVTVVVAASPAKAITAFSFPQGVGVITGTNIVATVPFGTNVTALVPTIVTTGASVSPLSLIPQNFTSPINYTVTAADGTLQVYTVTVVVAANPAKAITAFSFPQGVGVITGTNIVVTVPFGTGLTALIPTIITTGVSVAPLSGIARNFTTPQTYTVTAADGTTQVYTVTVTVAANPAKAITAFSFPQGVGVITGTNIVVPVPFGTDVTALVPTIVITGASISPLSLIPQNFTSPVTYTVTAANGSTQVYTVTVTVAANPAKAITAFSFPQGVGVITGTNIVVTVPFGTNVTALVPTIVTTGASIAPLSLIPQNFTSPVNYTVTAADATTQVYTVTVVVAANPAKAITAFGFPQGVGVITGTNIVVAVPFGTNVTALVPTIVITGASIAPLSGIARNFTSPVTYTVTAANGSTQVYTVTVTIAANPAKSITAFSFPEGVGVITANNIVVTVPFGTNVTALVPTIVTTGASISPLSLIPQNFTSPVNYTVTAADGTTQVYTVTVTVAANPAKAITSFSFPQGVGVITGTNIVATVPFGTDVTALVPTIVTTGASVSPLSLIPQNFASPVNYTVTAADGTTRIYTVTVIVAANPAKAITSFSFPQGVGSITGTNITVTVPFGTSLTALVPTIVITGASIAPLSGIARNFTSPVTYTVTAADGSIQVYTVTVTVAANPAKAITAFSFPEGVGVITGTNIVATVPFGTDVTALVPTIVTTGVSIAPLSGIARNFTTAQTYTVTAADGSTRAYTVTVIVAANPAKAITAFSFPEGVGVITGNNIVVTVPFATDVTALVPTIVTTGASVSPLSLTPQNFTSPVNYTVTAADGTLRVYTVTVTVAASPAKAITTFSFPEGAGVITANNITVTVPFGTDVTALVPTIVITGASVSPLSGVAANFTSPVTYTVTAADGTTKAYTVTVAVAANTAKAITAFSFPEGVGSISGTNIVVTVPFATDVTALVPTIVTTGTSVSPLSLIPQNFTSPVTYTVTAADGSTKAYTVTVTVAASPAKSITAFSFPEGLGIITGTNIAVIVPFGTDVTALVPTIVTTGASISPLSGIARNFTSPVNYTVTAADGTTQVYTVTVTLAPSPAKAIIAFSFPEGVGSISGTDIAVTVPFGTDVTALVPTIAISGASISPLSLVPQNFTTPLTYTVTAADGSTQVYTVTVTVAADTAKAITDFNFAEGVGIVDEGSHAIAVTVPFGTDVTALVPTIEITGASISPLSLVPQNFTSPVTYTVTAADGTTQSYTVTVTVASGSNPANISAFSFPQGDGVITGTNIAVTVPFGTNVTALVPTIVAAGSTVSPLSGAAQDFTSPVTYTVTTAGSGTPASPANIVTQVYTVTVTSAPNPANITYVQSGSVVRNPSNNSISRAFPLANTSGDLIVVSVSFDTASGTSWSCSDSKGNTYRKAISMNDTRHAQFLGICFAANIKAGANTVKVSFGGASQTSRRMSIQEYSGADLLQPLDKAAIRTGNSSATVSSSPAVTPSVNGELIFGSLDCDGTCRGTISATGGFRIRQTTGVLGSEDLVQASAASTGSAFLVSPRRDFISAVATFKPTNIVPSFPSTGSRDRNRNRNRR